MRAWLPPSLRTSVELEGRKDDLRPYGGSWIFLTPRSEHRTQVCAIINTFDLDISYCLGPEDSGTMISVVSRLKTFTRSWLDADSHSCVRISSDLKLPDNTPPFNGASVYNQVAIESLKVVLGYVKLIARLHIENRQPTRTFHLMWVPDKPDTCLPNQPENAMHEVLSSTDSRGLDALLRLLRFPTRFDGGADFIFEKYVKVALTLLFAPEDFLCVECTNDPVVQPTPDSPRLPLVIFGESREWDITAQNTFAFCAQATLTKLVKVSPQEHCIVYGLHCTNNKLRIIAHLPRGMTEDEAKDDDPTRLKFAQVMLAEHRISLEDLPDIQDLPICHDDDNALMFRWRISVALSKIHQHVQHLKAILGYTSSSYDGHPPHEGDTGQNNKLISAMSSRVDAKSYLGQLCSHWQSAKLSVPRSWIPPMQVDIDLPRRESLLITKNIITPMLPLLSKFVLHPIRDLLIPMDNEAIWKNHLSEEYCGPDFAHGIHVPRWRGKSKLTSETRFGEGPHLLRCYDFLTMATRSWDDINIFVAGIFAGFADYLVLWFPVAMYSTIEVKESTECDRIPTEDKRQSTEDGGNFEFETIDYRHGDIVVDFALSVRAVAVSTALSIKQAPQLPLTSCSPAALIGLRTTHMTDNGHCISDDEVKDIKNLIAIHYQPILSALSDNKEKIPEWATMMGTFLKKGFIHLLAFSYTRGEDGPMVCVDIIDSLPIQMTVNGLGELEDRMRLVIALFTLQNHVIRFASHWHEITLPWYLMAAEDVAIGNLKVASMSTCELED